MDQDDDDEEALEVMPEEAEAESTGDPKTCLVAFKKVVIDLLEENELDQKRASKMEIVDFLNLLVLFNGKGIHFK